MKELTQHETNSTNMALKIGAVGARGVGGAFTAYEISGFDVCKHPYDWATDANMPMLLLFQSGPVDEGINGVTNEALLAILADRLRDFQNGPFSNKFNAAALNCVEEALTHLHARTLERTARGVEGTHGL